MNLATISVKGLTGQSLSLSERAMAFCRTAKQLEKAGEFELAREALLEVWPEQVKPPILDGLAPAAAAEVLLRVGALTAALGSVAQTAGGQESAKNLITRSIEIFEGLGEIQRVAEARSDLALCYWREGAFDEARINLTRALADLKDHDGDLKAVVMVRAGMVEVFARRLNDALQIHTAVASLVNQSTDETLKGAFHNGLGLVLRNLAPVENREDYLDRALIEYAAASFHFEQAGNTRYQASVEINLGFLFCTLGKFDEAHEHLDRARRLFVQLNDNVHLAQVNDTRARTFLGEGRLSEAERFARAAVKAFERGGEQSLLTEALTTRGIITARLGKHAVARASLERAIEVAEVAGDLEGAGRARLSIIEELEQQTPPSELASLYDSAAEYMRQSQDPAAARRLVECSRIVIGALERSDVVAEQPQVQNWNGFSLRKQTLKFEKTLIERALRDSGGAVTKAARLLGLNNHQSLIAVLNGRHKDLLGVRTAVRIRRRAIMSDRKARAANAD